MAVSDSLLEQRLRYHAENSPLGVIELDERLRVQYWSKQAERIFGYGAAEVSRRDLLALGLFHPDDVGSVEEAVAALRSGRMVRNTQLHRNVHKDGSILYCEWYTSAVRDASGSTVSILSLVHDVTAQRRSEEDRARSALEVQILAEAGKRLVTAALDVPTRLRTIVRLAIPLFADWSQIDLLTEDGAIRTQAIAHRDRTLETRLRAFCGEVNVDEHSKRAIPLALRSGAPLVCPVFADSSALISLASRDVPLYRALATDDSSAIVLPLRARGQLLGALTLGRDDPAHRYSDADLALASELALLSELSLDNSLLYEREHRVADTLQRAMLPSALPVIDGYVFDSAYSPAATESEVGGDWYDAFPLPDGRIAISIGDVTGHGLEAAAIMGEVRQSIRASALADESPVSVLDRANQLLSMRHEPAIVTAVFGIIDPPARTLWYATAGHPAPLLAVDDGVRALPAQGLPLGSLRIPGEDESFRIPLPPGSLLVLYTDGLIEFERDLFAGEERLRAAVAREASRPSAHPAESIKARVLSRAAQSDDIAILTVGVEPVPVNVAWTIEPHDRVGAHALRRHVARKLRTFANAESDLAAAEVALGELLTNAIEHAPTTVRLELDWEDRVAKITIGDLGPGVNRDRRLPDAFSERGRGIYLIAHLCPEFEVETVEGQTVARVTLPVYRDVAALAVR